MSPCLIIKSVLDARNIVPAPNNPMGPDVEVSSWEKAGITGTTCRMIGAVEKVRVLREAGRDVYILYHTAIYR